MRRITTALAALAPAMILASAGHAQAYWTDEWGDPELNRPLAGYEYEYDDNGRLEDINSQEYEWEPGTGYHEEEWWDPSDWFDTSPGVDYEETGYYGSWFGDNDDYDYDGYSAYGFDDTYYPYNDSMYGRGNVDGWRYDSIGNYDSIDYDDGYGYRDQPANDFDYNLNQQFNGRVMGLRRVSGGVGEPDSVVLNVRTQDGATRYIQLGDVSYSNRYLPRIQRGEQVVIGGHTVNQNGRNLFKANEIRTADRSYLVPKYEYRKRIEGKITGLRRVRLRGSNVEAIVADFLTRDGDRMSVLVGDVADLRGAERTIRPGTPVRVDGYSREVNGKSSFVVQNLSLRRNQNGSNAQGTRNAMSRTQQMQRQRRTAPRQGMNNRSAGQRNNGGW